VNIRLTLVSLVALMGISLPRIASAFSKIDVDKKGYVTLDQIKAMILKN
jgi:hypothetical protein